MTRKSDRGDGRASRGEPSALSGAPADPFLDGSAEDEPRIKVASFFAGIGGFDLGFERAGMETVWQCEKKPFCLDILEQHWPLVPRATDIQEVDADEIPNAAVWAGGFPCQDVSLARMGPRSGLRGKQSGLFYDFAQLIGERRPPLVILENVAALLSSHDGRDFAIVLRSLAELGYGLAWRVLDSRYFGVPQSRTRVFVVGSLGGAASAGSVLFEPECGDRDSEKGRPNGEKSVSPFAISVGNPEQGFVKKLAHCLYAESARHTGTDWSRNYVSYPDGRVRRLTPLETERLQGFPDDWTVPKEVIENENTLDSARYHACGNAVSVPVAEWIGHRIVSELGTWLLDQQAQNEIDKSS
jgi:DNA (cytosine-5)-methyltransferase 1